MLLQDALSMSFDEWNVNSSKLVAITTDNRSNIKLACQLLKLKCLSCFGNNLDLAASKIVELIEYLACVEE